MPWANQGLLFYVQKCYRHLHEYRAVTTRSNELNTRLRRLCSGKTLAFQAKDAGSIPARRSNYNLAGFPLIVCL